LAGGIIFMNEHDLQKAVVRWARLFGQKKYYELELLHAIPNGAHLKSGARGWAKLQLEGALKGIPDLHLPVPKGQYASLYIEMKKKGGKLSVEQQNIINKLIMHNNFVAVCYSADDAIKTLVGYCGLKGLSI
jgi:hypothetical protein